jgi:hypothetical protein
MNDELRIVNDFVAAESGTDSIGVARRFNAGNKAITGIKRRSPDILSGGQLRFDSCGKNRSRLRRSDRNDILSSPGVKTPGYLYRIRSGFCCDKIVMNYELEWNPETISKTGQDLRSRKSKKK